MTIQEKIESRLKLLSVGCVTTLWDLLVWRVSEDSYVIGHRSISMTASKGVSLAAAVERFERLLD